MLGKRKPRWGDESQEHGNRTASGAQPQPGGGTVRGVTPPRTAAGSGGYTRPLRPDYVPFVPDGKHLVTEFLAQAPIITFAPEAYRRQCVYTELGPKEVAWMGTVERIGNRLHIDRVYLLRQEVADVEVTLSREGQAELSDYLTDIGDVELANRLQFWGHSHVEFRAEPSPVDEQTPLQYDDGRPFFIRFIINKRGETHLTVYLFDQGLKLTNVDWAVVDDDGNVLLDRRHRLSSDYAWDYLEAGNGKGGDVSSRGLFARMQGRSFPQPLIPTDALRREVQAEFAQKVNDMQSRRGK